MIAIWHNTQTNAPFGSPHHVLFQFLLVWGGHFARGGQGGEAVEQEPVNEKGHCFHIKFVALEAVLGRVTVGEGEGGTESVVFRLNLEAEDAGPRPTAVEVEPAVGEVEEPFVVHVAGDEPLLDGGELFGRVGSVYLKFSVLFRERFDVPGVSRCRHRIYDLRL